MEADNPWQIYYARAARSSWSPRQRTAHTLHLGRLYSGGQYAALWVGVYLLEPRSVRSGGWSSKLVDVEVDIKVFVLLHVELAFGTQIIVATEQKQRR